MTLRQEHRLIRPGAEKILGSLLVSTEGLMVLRRQEDSCITSGSQDVLVRCSTLKSSHDLQRRTIKSEIYMTQNMHIPR